MGSNWTKVTIESIQANQKGAIAIGPFGSRLKSDNYVDSGIPVIRGTNLTDGATFTGKFVYISQEKADSLGSSNVYQHDLVFPHRGSIGEVGIITDNKRYILSSSLMKLTVDVSQVNPKYLYYFFRSSAGRHELLKNSSQVGTPGIGQPLTSLKSIEFEKPSLEEQDKIVKILSELDNKITLNRQINQTLEQMAKALFRSWFVDFDPVVDNALDAGFFEQNLEFSDELLHRAEARKAARESADFKPLPDDIRQQFPTVFEECSEPSLGLGGWVPEGWKQIELSKLANIIMGQSPKGDTYNDDGIGIPLVNGPVEFGEYHPVKTKWTTYTTKISKKNDLIVCVRGSTTGRYVISDGAYCLGRGVCAIRAGDIQPFVIYQFKYHISTLLGLATGSTFPSWSGPTLKRYRVLEPQPILVKQFCKIVSANLTKMSEMDFENITLMNIRDTLLPKLISGELRLSDSEVDTADEVLA